MLGTRIPQAAFKLIHDIETNLGLNDVGEEEL